MLKIIKILVWLVVIFGGIFWWQYQSFLSQKVTVDFMEGYMTVEKGENFSSVLSKIFGNEVFVKLYLRQNPPDFGLQAGKYQIPSGTIEEIIEALKKPLNESDENITFLEGWNIYDIDKTLVSEWLIKAGAFVDFVTSCESFCPLKADYAFISDAETLEGFLYPDTYAVNPTNFTIESLVRKMLTNFQVKVIDSGILPTPPNLPLSRGGENTLSLQETLTLASIVQKEANKRDNPEEIALIAGILKKRAVEGWQIGADATVCYPFKIPTQDCGPDEVLKYLYDKNEYNTRQMVWLPRWPIVNPEADIIKATIQSKASAYYYYLHDNTGKIHYGVTNADHESNKQKYLY